ncbi:uncharacterized protein LOC136091517 [Hydra vulgaris]|uniref:Uncharacterized protein LOC136091517 n=1 Tax=Hydra vulgaris TaxID=6087 RepID=A0ABM4DL12_HYDVU
MADKIDIKIYPLVRLTEIDSQGCLYFGILRKWTLKYLEFNETHTEKSKPQNDLQCKNVLNKFLNDSRVKRIIYSNNSVVNRGCTKYTAQCKERSYFNFKLMKRVNTPPCCREKLLKMLSCFTHELQRLNVTHMLAFGSVLGWARNGKLVPYDHDIDLIADKRFWKTNLFDDILQKLENENGFKTKILDNGVKLRILYSSTNRNFIEAWPYEITKRKNISKVKVPHNDWIVQPLENIFPERYVSFESIMTYVPRDPPSYLNILYKNWKNELDCSYKVGKKCSEKRSKNPAIKNFRKNSIRSKRM